MSLLDFAPISSTRRNHALEHATIHILSRMLPQTSMAGRSTSRGFFIYGDLSTDALVEALQEAIRRMRAGEAYLAIHPNCGTNLVTTAVLTAGATMAASAGRGRHLIDRIPAGLLAALVAAFTAQFVGTLLQARVTTSADLGVVDVLTVERRQMGRRVWHWVGLQHGPTPASP